MIWYIHVVVCVAMMDRRGSIHAATCLATTPARSYRSLDALRHNVYASSSCRKYLTRGLTGVPAALKQVLHHCAVLCAHTYVQTMAVMARS